MPRHPPRPAAEEHRCCGVVLRMGGRKRCEKARWPGSDLCLGCLTLETNGRPVERVPESPAKGAV